MNVFIRHFIRIVIDPCTVVGFERIALFEHRKSFHIGEIQFAVIAAFDLRMSSVKHGRGYVLRIAIKSSVLYIKKSRRPVIIGAAYNSNIFAVYSALFAVSRYCQFARTYCYDRLRPLKPEAAVSEVKCEIALVYNYVFVLAVKIRYVSEELYRAVLVRTLLRLGNQGDYIVAVFLCAARQKNGFIIFVAPRAFSVLHRMRVRNDCNVLIKDTVIFAAVNLPVRRPERVSVGEKVGKALYLFRAERVCRLVRSVCRMEGAAVHLCAFFEIDTAVKDAVREFYVFVVRTYGSALLTVLRMTYDCNVFKFESDCLFRHIIACNPDRRLRAAADGFYRAVFDDYLIVVRTEKIPFCFYGEAAEIPCIIFSTGKSVVSSRRLFQKFYINIAFKT